MLWARVAAGAELTPATVAAAEEIAGVHFEPAERELLLDGLKRQEQQLDALHALPLDNAVAAAVPRDANLAFLGAGPYRDQVIDEDAEVVRRLDAAGAVLVAKLTLGELAQGDVWFGRGPTDAAGDEAKTRGGQRTRNPWKPDQGSSGSSAGPASAVAAGLVAFAIGSETLGSISSPSTRCGTTGLRPTFGRVPRTGAMALSWSMDKLGPLARSAADCALVLDAIRGPDRRDAACADMPYAWRPERASGASLGDLRVGYVRSAFDLAAADPNDPKRTPHPTKPFDDAALAVLRERIGVRLVPVELPDALTTRCA